MATASGSSPSTSNIISGKILHKESGNGIADLLVELFDLDNWADPEGGDSAVIARSTDGTTRDPTAPIIRGDISSLYKVADRIGSVITDSSGKFVFDVTPKDFNLPWKAEQKPDLLLVVLAPDEPGLDINKRLLHFTKDIYFNAGSKEAYIIRLPTALLIAKDIPFGEQKEESSEAIKNRVGHYINERTREQEFNTGVSKYHGEQSARESQEREEQ